LPSILFQPNIEGLHGIRLQWNAACLAALPKTTNVRTGTELYILAREGDELTIAQAGLDGDKYQRAISPSNPLGGVGRLDECSAFTLVEELDRATFVALIGNGKDTLAEESMGGLAEGNVAEERTQCGEPGVSCSHADAPFHFEMDEELHEECRIEILDLQVGRWSP
jgi:hypothetical protein